MSKKNTHPSAEESVENALNATEQFLEKNQKKLVYSVVAIFVIAAIGFSYNQFYRKPLKEDAMAQSFIAEREFANDNFEVALNGDGNNLGFNQIIKEYGSAAPASVHFYVGICNLHLGNFEEAISALKKYKGEDPIMNARAIANIGDAYAGMQKNKEALSNYLKAAQTADNIFAAGYMLKAAIMHEELSNPKEAIKLYQEIKVKYPQSAEAMDADKYIARLETEQ